MLMQYDGNCDYVGAISIIHRFSQFYLKKMFVKFYFILLKNILFYWYWSFGDIHKLIGYLISTLFMFRLHLELYVR